MLGFGASGLQGLEFRALGFRVWVSWTLGLGFEGFGV